LKYFLGIFTLSILFLSACQPQIKTETIIHVRIQTELGDIDIDLFADQAPITVDNFLNNMDAGVYNNGYFYRAARPDNQPAGAENPLSVIQGGNLEHSINRPQIAHETTVISGLDHQVGTLSMARFAPGTASSEFFISMGDNRILDY